MQGEIKGTIRSKEAKSVVADFMAARKIPRSVWSITPRGGLSFMVNGHITVVDLPAGQTFNGLTRALERIGRLCDEYHNRVVDRRQIDLEDAIRERTPA